MDAITLNIVDSRQVFSGEVSCTVCDAVIAALSAEPETFDELREALTRFVSHSDTDPLHFFRQGVSKEPPESGVVIVDLPARLVAQDSSSCPILTGGQILYLGPTHDSEETWLPYQIPTDWVLLPSIREYEAIRETRTNERNANPLIDPRPVLYGDPMLEFILSETFAAHRGFANGPGVSHTTATTGRSEESRPHGPEDHPFDEYAPTPESQIIAGIHARWLMTPRDDLGGKTPRQLLVAKMNFINLDLQYREYQWSMLREGPPPLPRDSFAYKYAGFGMHEFVVYYELIRHLLAECWKRTGSGEAIETASELARLRQIEEAWLDSREGDFSGRVPSEIIESERRRIPLIMSGGHAMIDDGDDWDAEPAVAEYSQIHDDVVIEAGPRPDEFFHPDCDLCRMLASDSLDMGPGFWHLDGCNMDEGFAFSIYETVEEWEEEERSNRECDEEFARKLAAGEFDRPNYPDPWEETSE